MNSMNVTLFLHRSVAQLIDANLDRAREGLRVIEDWCRYEVRNKEYVLTIKDWRHQLGSKHLDTYKEARSISSDHGIGLNHKSQEQRTEALQIIKANCGRVQEALRVLEEFTRNSNPDLSKISQKIRYGLYDLEIKIIKHDQLSIRKNKLYDSNLYLITSDDKKIFKKVTDAINSGVNIVQFRCKELNDKDKLKQAQQIALICKKNGALFIVNDRVDIAISTNADGVHIGQEDLPVKVVRDILGPEKLIGKSIHSIEQLREAQLEGCDYIGFGPIHETKTKPNLIPKGIRLAEQVSQEASIPSFAIGGININNIDELLSIGVERIAISGSIMNHPKTSEIASKFKELLK